MKSIFSKKQRGFALVEMIVYISIMVIILIAIVNVVITVTRTNKVSFVEYNIKNSAISGLEEMTKEIRNAKSINYIQSVFSPSTNGVLSLNTIDSLGNNETVKFYLENQILMVDISGVSTSTGGILTTKDVKVLSLIFTPINTTNSKAVKIEMVLSGSSGGFVKDDDFYSTVVLRGSY